MNKPLKQNERTGRGRTLFSFFLAFFLKWSGKTFQSSLAIRFSVAVCEKWFRDIGGLIMIRCWQQAIILQVSTSTIFSLEESNPSFPELPSRTHHSATSTCLRGPEPETIVRNYPAERNTVQCAIFISLFCLQLDAYHALYNTIFHLKLLL